MNTNIKIKFFITIALVFVMLLSMSTFSLSGEEYSVFIALKSSSTLNKGEIVTVNVTLIDINAGNGIDVIVAKLNYDTNVFQMLTPNDFNSNTGWKVSYAPNSNILTAINKNKITQNQTVFHIRFKIKSEINIDTTTISLQNIMVSGGRIIDGGTDDISVNNASITLNRAIDVVTDSKTNDIKPNSAVEPNISIPTSNILNSKTLSTIETNINESANLKNEIINDINSNMAENSDLISKQIDVQNVAENLKTPEVLKETNSNDITIVKAQSQNSNKIQNTVIGSASSISFLSICCILLKKIVF